MTRTFRVYCETTPPSFSSGLHWDIHVHNYNAAVLSQETSTYPINVPACRPGEEQARYTVPLKSIRRVCRNCSRQRTEHSSEGRCLFSPTTWELWGPEDG